MEALLSVEALITAFDSLAEGVMIFDIDETIVYQNAAAFDLVSIPAGSKWIDLHHALERSTPDGEIIGIENAPVVRALAGETIRDEEIWVHHKASGKDFVWIYNAVPVLNHKGEIQRVVLSIRDVTDLKQKQAALEETTTALKKKNEDLERFTIMVSHDLKEPLRTIRLFSQLLSHRTAGQLDEHALQCIHLLTAGIDRMDVLIDDLSRLTGLDAEDHTAEAVDANLALGAALQELRFKIEELEAIVTYDPLPMVWAHHGLLVQLFHNLLANALKYCTLRPKINVSGELCSGHVVISVADNGIGIEPQYADKIFDAFQRLHTRGEYPGTGIGLTICRRIVERYQGRIWVDSEPGNGSTFRFSLPAFAQ